MPTRPFAYTQLPGSLRKSFRSHARFFHFSKVLLLNSPKIAPNTDKTRDKHENSTATFVLHTCYSAATHLLPAQHLSQTKTSQVLKTWEVENPSILLFFVSFVPLVPLW